MTLAQFIEQRLGSEQSAIVLLKRMFVLSLRSHAHSRSRANVGQRSRAKSGLAKMRGFHKEAPFGASLS